MKSIVLILLLSSFSPNPNFVVKDIKVETMEGKNLGYASKCEDDLVFFLEHFTPGEYKLKVWTDKNIYDITVNKH